MVIKRYFFNIFLKTFAVVQLFVVVLYFFFNILSHSKFMHKYKVGFFDVLMYDMIRIPISIQQTIPVAVIASLVISLLIIIKSKEMLAYLSLGGKLSQLFIMYILFGLGVSVFMFIMADSIVPYMFEKSERYKVENFEKGTFIKSNKISKMWLKDGDNKFVSIELLDPIEKKASGIRVYSIDNSSNIVGITSIDETIKLNEKWIGKGVKVYDLQDVPKMVKFNKEEIIHGDFFDKLMKIPTISPKSLKILEILKIIEIYKSRGINPSKYQIIYYSKFSFVLNIITLIILVFPAAINLSRTSSYIHSAVVSMVLTFSFWIVYSSFISMGKSGLLDPFTANFAPHIIFLSFALIIIYMKKNIFGFKIKLS